MLQAALADGIPPFSLIYLHFHLVKELQSSRHRALNAPAAKGSSPDAAPVRGKQRYCFVSFTLIFNAYDNCLCCI